MQNDDIYNQYLLPYKYVKSTQKDQGEMEVEDGTPKNTSCYDMNGGTDALLAEKKWKQKIKKQKRLNFQKPREKRI